MDIFPSDQLQVTLLEQGIGPDDLQRSCQSQPSCNFTQEAVDRHFSFSPQFTQVQQDQENRSQIFLQPRSQVIAWADSIQDRGEEGTLCGTVGPLLLPHSFCGPRSSLLIPPRLSLYAVMNSISHKQGRGRNWPQALVTFTPALTLAQAG